MSCSGDATVRGQAAVVPQTCTWAGAVRVVMPRGACGNACLLLILWSRWRCRSVVTRAVAITVRARWWAAARAGAGSEAVAVPARTVVIRVRRAVVNDRCRAATGCPVRGPLRNGVAMAAAERVAAWTSSVATIQAACSWRISSGLCRAQDRPGARAGVVDGGLGLPQGGLRAVPAPPVGLRQLVRGVGGVVEQVGDQAKQLGCGLPVHADVVLDDPHGHGGAAAGQAGQVGPVGGERADAGQPDVGLDADQDVAAGGQQRRDPRHAGEVPIHDPQPVGGEHVGLLGQHPVQQRLLGLALVPTGLVPAGRAGHHGQGGPGERVGDVQVTDLRVAGLGLPGGAERGPVRRVSGIRVTVPSIAPSRSPPPTSTRGRAGSRCSVPTAASSSRCSCSSGASPIAARQVDSTVGEGTACGRRHGTAISSPSSVVSTSR